MSEFYAFTLRDIQPFRQPPSFQRAVESTARIRHCQKQCLNPVWKQRGTFRNDHSHTDYRKKIRTRLSARTVHPCNRCHRGKHRNADTFVHHPVLPQCRSGTEKRYPRRYRPCLDRRAENPLRLAEKKRLPYHQRPGRPQGKRNRQAVAAEIRTAFVRRRIPQLL